VDRDRKCIDVLAPSLDTSLDNAAQQSFTFDFVLDEQASQILTYQTMAAPMVESFLGGFNASILACECLFPFSISPKSQTDRCLQMVKQDRAK